MKFTINTPTKFSSPVGPNMKALLFMSFTLVLLSTAAMLESCTSSRQVTGRPIDPQTVSKIVDGKTTVDQILASFGAPTSTSALGESQLYIYKYCISSGSGLYTGYFGQTKTEEKCDELTVTFDKDGKVRAHNFIKRNED